MLQDRINKEYFEWLSDIVSRRRYAGQASFTELLRCLHSIEFEWILDNDAHRADDGMDLRYRFACEYEKTDYAERYLDGPCSVLEMMVALALRCEETIMDDPRYGNRTSQWFWGMVGSLGLAGMTDSRFDPLVVRTTIKRFLNRAYDRDGRGGLFTLRNHPRDLRDVEIWVQLLWYLDRIT